jgi:hypothetical protein
MHQFCDLLHDLGKFQHFICIKIIRCIFDSMESIIFFGICVGINIKQFMEWNF